jgi:hypothetical protein
MTKVLFRRITFLLALMVSLGACRGDASPENVLFGLASANRWPVVIFVKETSFAMDAFWKGAEARNSGWDTQKGDVPLRGIAGRGDDLTTMEVEILWYEVVTQSTYRATLSVQRADLGIDAIRRDFGTLVLRTGPHGYVEAVTYRSDPYPAQAASATILAQTCGTPDQITSAEDQADLERLLDDPLIREAFANTLSPADAPSTCGARE